MSSDLDLEALLAPLDAAAPCGSNLEYDAAFVALTDAGRARQEQEYGDTRIEGQGPDWSTVWDLALALWSRTRDLRVAVWLARCATHRSGLVGATVGLQLIHGLLERFWESVHPQLDADDHDDPTERLNALAPLGHYAEFLADLRAVTLNTGRGLKPMRLRDVELAIGHVEPAQGEEVPPEESLRAGLQAIVTAEPSIAESLKAGHAAARGIVDLVDAHTGSALGPDLAPLVKLLRLLAQAVTPPSAAGTATADRDPRQAAYPAVPSAGSPAASSTNSAEPEARAWPVASPAAGALRSRQDAVDALERVCAWIESHEPSNPAPLFIRRAQRLMSKSFIEIIQDLTPDAEAEVRRLAGIVSQ